MNDNYLAPEVFDTSKIALCLNCGRKSIELEHRILFFRGKCAYCGHNPHKSMTLSSRDIHITYNELPPARTIWFQN